MFNFGFILITTGPKWDKKVKACVSLIDKYMMYSRKPLLKNTEQVPFYNTENDNSAAHGLACKNGVKCVENVQLYSILRKIYFHWFLVWFCSV